MKKTWSRTAASLGRMTNTFKVLKVEKKKKKKVKVAEPLSGPGRQGKR